MKIGILKEQSPGENRVALVPTAIASLMKAKLVVQIEAGAGVSARFVDADSGSDCSGPSHPRDYPGKLGLRFRNDLNPHHLLVFDPVTLAAGSFGS